VKVRWLGQMLAVGVILAGHAVTVRAESAHPVKVEHMPPLTPAHKRPSESRPGVTFHAGAEARAGYQVHPLRLGGGVGVASWELRAVLDPLFFVDNVHDADLSVSYWFGDSAYALSAGWRPTTILLDPGAEWQHSLLVGGFGRLPSLGVSWLRAVAGAELSLLLLRHGAGVPAAWTCFCDSVSASEALGFSLLLRLEYVSAD